MVVPVHSGVQMQSHMDEVSSCGSQEDKEAAQAQESAGVQGAPVETLLETPMSANNSPSSDRTGILSHMIDCRPVSLVMLRPMH